MIRVELDREDGVYAPGDLLQCNWKVGRVPMDKIQFVEASVLWHTEGKGDEDLAVHHFTRHSEEELRASGEGFENSLVAELPKSPLTYDGRLLRIRWSVRLRVAITGDPDTVVSQPFYLGYAEK